MTSPPSSRELDEVRRWATARVRLLFGPDVTNEDIVASVVSDYWKQRSREKDDEVEADNDRARLALAAQIFRWRAADHFRARAHRAATQLESELDMLELPDGSPSPYSVTLHERIFADTIQLMTCLPEQDRALLLREVDPDSGGSTLDARERQRLARARRRLLDALKARYGESLSTLLDQTTTGNHDDS